MENLTFTLAPSLVVAAVLMPFTIMYARRHYATSKVFVLGAMGGILGFGVTVESVWAMAAHIVA